MGDTPQAFPAADEHAQLMKKVGDWKVVCQYFLGGETIATEGTDTIQALGPYWTRGSFQCDMMGQTIQGMSTTGYDPATKKFVGTWQDSATPFFYYFEGEIDDEGRLVMEGDNYDPVSQETAIYRSIETLGDRQRKLQLFIVKPELEPIQVLEYDYTRA